MPRIVIDNASVSYFLRQHGKFNVKNGAAGTSGAIGATVFQRRNYLEIAALRDVSLTIEDGDRVGLIGINGSGKSTLLKLCAGALATQSGSIRIEGKVNPQFSLGAGIRAPLTGRRNAELKCLYMGVPQRTIAARIEEVKELSGLGQYFELPISSYSAGMRSRLTMGLLKLVRADILVMDEWIGVADRTVTETANKLRADLIESTSIFVVASHSEGILRDWTTRLVWLANGYVKMVGPTEDVLAAYNETKGV